MGGVGFTSLDRPPVTQAGQLAWIEGILRPPASEPFHDKSAEETSDLRGRAYAEQALHEIEAELAATGESERNEPLYRAHFGSPPWRPAGGSPGPRPDSVASCLSGEWIDQRRRRAGVSADARKRAPRRLEGPRGTEGSRSIRAPEERAGTGKDDTKGDTKEVNRRSRSSSAAPGDGRNRNVRFLTTGAAICRSSL